MDLGVPIHRTTIIQITCFLTLPLLPLLFRFKFKNHWANVVRRVLFSFALQNLLDFNKERLGTGPCIRLSCKPYRVEAKQLELWHFKMKKRNPLGSSQASFGMKNSAFLLATLIYWISPKMSRGDIECIRSTESWTLSFLKFLSIEKKDYIERESLPPRAYESQSPCLNTSISTMRLYLLCSPGTCSEHSSLPYICWYVAFLFFSSVCSSG